MNDVNENKLFQYCYVDSNGVFAPQSWMHLFFIRVLFLCVTVPSGKGFYFPNNFDDFRVERRNICLIPPDCKKISRCRTETARRQILKAVSNAYCC